MEICDFISKTLLMEAKGIVLKPARFKRMTFSDIPSFKKSEKE